MVSCGRIENAWIGVQSRKRCGERGANDTTLAVQADGACCASTPLFGKLLGGGGRDIEQARA